jgi:hypothetical protein
MEITNHGRGLLEFIERLYAVIDGFQCVCSAGILLKDYVLKLMVSMCVFCWNLVTVYMLGLLQHVWCVFMPKYVLCSEIVIRCRNCVGCRTDSDIFVVATIWT